MALEALCGVKDVIKLHNNENLFSNEVLNYTRNFQNNVQLAIPPLDSGFPNKLGELNSDASGKHLKIQFDHGTTTLGFQYQGGIVLSVDSRATSGPYIASQSVRKVIVVNDFMLATMAGGAADCVYWDRVLTKECRHHELQNRERISIAAASKLMANMIYNYKGMGLSIGMMLAGWDKRGPGLYYIDSEGQRVPGKVFSVGSGSVYAFGVLDSGYRWDLTDEEAFELGRRSIYHATYRDSYSGGIARVYHMTKDGWINISNQDVKELHYKYKDEEK